MQMKRLLSLSFLLFLLCSCAQTESDVPSDWLLTGADRWSIRYPNSWNVDPGGPKPHGVAIAQEIDAEEKKYIMEITVTLNDFTDSGITLDEFVGAKEYQGANMLPDFMILHKAEREILATAGKEMIYTTRIDGNLFKYFQYYFIIDEIGVTLTYSSESKYFGEHQDEAKKILQSFSWSEKNLTAYHPL